MEGSRGVDYLEIEKDQKFKKMIGDDGKLHSNPLDPILFSDKLQKIN